MFSIHKRRSLKYLGSATAIAAIPSISKANSLLEATLNSQVAVQPVVEASNKSVDLAVAISSGEQSSIMLTNNGVHPISVKHVHPGIVHAGKKTFDINSVFERGAQLIEPGTSLEFAIQTTKSTQAETNFPRDLYRKLPHRAVSVTGVDNRGQFVNSTRSFYS